MDFSIISYDNGNNDFTGFRRLEPVITTSFITQLMKQLYAARTAKQLAQRYVQHISECLPLVKLNVRSDEFHWSWAAHTLTPNCRIHLPLQDEAGVYDPVQDVGYGFAHDLTQAQRQALQMLHPLFTLQLAQLNELLRLQKVVTKDVLTGLGNRAGYNDACHRMIARYQRNGKVFALLVLDLDNFKAVNDGQGHLLGDQVIKAVAITLESVLRGDDQAFRFGGDEFCCLLDCHNEKALTLIAQRLQRALKKHLLLQRHGVSCSIGGAIFTPNDNEISLFERADCALYQVKQNGKNAFLAA